MTDWWPHESHEIPDGRMEIRWVSTGPRCLAVPTDLGRRLAVLATQSINRANNFRDQQPSFVDRPGCGESITLDKMLLTCAVHRRWPNGTEEHLLRTPKGTIAWGVPE